MPPFLASAAAKALAAIVVVALIFAAGFGTAWHIKNGDEARAALAQAQATTKEIKHQVAVAQSEGAAGQALADVAAGAFEGQKTKIQTVTKTLVQQIPQFIAPNPVMETNNAAPAENGPAVIYGLPWGFVRLYDCAATLCADPSAIPIAPGESDDAPSSVDLSRALSVSIQNSDAYYECRAQNDGLIEWARGVELWYADLVKKISATK